MLIVLVTNVDVTTEVTDPEVVGIDAVVVVAIFI